MTLLREARFCTDEQNASYGVGLQFGNQLRRNDFDVLDAARPRRWCLTFTCSTSRANH